MECAEGANGAREPFKAENFWKSAPCSVYRRNAVVVALFWIPQKSLGCIETQGVNVMKIVSALTFLIFGLLAPAQTQPANDTTTQPPGVWVKLDQTLNTSFTRPGDKISAVLQEDVAVKDQRLPKGTKLTGTVLKSVRQDKEHSNSGLALLFDTAQMKNGMTLPVHVTLASIAPSHSDEVEQITLGSGGGTPSSPTGGPSSGSPIAARSTDANWIAANAMGELDDPNETKTAHTATKVNGWVATSSIKGVTLLAIPNGSSSGVVIAETGPLQLTKWTRINLVVSPR
jgi:hypothetical protein